MKINIVYIFVFLSAMGLVTACTQDGMTDNTPLPEGSCPLGLNVSIADNGVATRATPDGTWKGDGTESVTVGVSFDPLTKPTPYRYTVIDADGSMTSENPYYWQNTYDNLFVWAWYPYAESLTSVGGNDDQSTEAGFQAADRLCSDINVVLYANRQYDIELYHITAKVVVNLVREGIMVDGREAIVTLGDARNPIYLYGSMYFLSFAPSIGDFSGFSADTDGETGFVKPLKVNAAGEYAATYQALLIPQEIGGKKFIAVTIDGVTCYYTPPAGTYLEGGKCYTYNVTVDTSSEVTVGSIEPGEWGNGGSYDLTAQ